MANKKPILCKVGRHKWKPIKELSNKSSISASIICEDGSEIRATAAHYGCVRCDAEKTVLSI